MKNIKFPDKIIFNEQKRGQEKIPTNLIGSNPCGNFDLGFGILVVATTVNFKENIKLPGFKHWSEFRLQQPEGHRTKLWQFDVSAQTCAQISGLVAWETCEIYPTQSVCCSSPTFLNENVNGSAFVQTANMPHKMK